MCVILGFYYRIIDEDTEHYLTLKFMDYCDKGNSHFLCCWLFKEIFNFAVHTKVDQISSVNAPA